MNIHKTDIEWCSHTWNPVTGCRHGCEYCYAQRIVSRFEPKIDEWPDEAITTAPSADGGPELYVVERPTRLKTKEGGYRRPTPYPKGFAPTLHAYTLTYPEQRKAPSNIEGNIPPRRDTRHRVRARSRPEERRARAGRG